MGSTNHELATLIDLERVQRLCDSLSAALDIALAVLDPDGIVPVATGWQDICTCFHREDPETLRGSAPPEKRWTTRSSTRRA